MTLHTLYRHTYIPFREDVGAGVTFFIKLTFVRCKPTVSVLQHGCSVEYAASLNLNFLHFLDTLTPFTEF
jgi:hypothetical protein